MEVLFRGEPVIRKTAQSEEYYPRLHAQRVKQQRHAESTPPSVLVPRVIAYGENWFEMEYLHMPDCIQFFEGAPKRAIEERCETLLDLVSRALERSHEAVLETDAVVAKLESARRRLGAAAWDSLYAPYGDVIGGLLRSTPRFTYPCGDCHGDLTLSNVLFSVERNQIGLIDFLDTFVETPLVDIIKLRQDSRFHWTSHVYQHDHDRAKIRIINGWLDQIITARFGCVVDGPTFVVLELLNYLRIAPYVSDRRAHGYLVAALASLT